MGTKDELFAAKLLATFRVEAEEHVKALSDGLLRLESHLPPNQQQEWLETVFREAHSLKGAARSVDQPLIQELCQSLENVLSAWKKGTLEPSPGLFDVLHASVRTIESALSAEPELSVVNATVRQLEGLLTPEPSTTSDTSTELLPPDVPLKQLGPQIEQLIHPDSSGGVVKQESKPAAVDLPRDKTIRITLSKLDRLFQESEEMLMVKLVTQQTAIELKSLLTAMHSREKELSLLIANSRSLRQHLHHSHVEMGEQKVISKVLDFLERQQQENKSLRDTIGGLHKRSTQNAHFVGALVDTLLEDIKKVLMQPLATVFESFPRMIRDIGKELHKDVQFECQGGDIEVDRRILEEIKDPLIHLLRNAIDHGIEQPEERLQKGKLASGLIRIVATETGGGHVELSISDDGRGLDIEKLKSVALNQSLMSPQELGAISDQEAMKLAFASGVSTSPTITSLSGRGLGLGIVSEKVDNLGGHVLVESIPGQGATFKLILPLTLATFRGIHITVGARDFIIPAHNVKRVIRFPRETIKTIEARETINVDNHILAFVHLADLLGIANQTDAPKGDESLFALIIRSEDKTIAFGADAIHREHEVLVKSLGKQCTRVKNIMAATIMEWGKVIPILNPIDLVRSATNGSLSTSSPRATAPAKARRKIVLIAEDSMTTRLLEKNILESAGYEVVTATDGLEAYEILQQQPIDLLVTDLEMPRMDGFTLTEKVRSLPATKSLPIVICTGKGSKEDRERGLEIGANAYLTKSSFSQSALINTVQRLL